MCIRDSSGPGYIPPPIEWGTCASARMQAAGARCGLLTVPLDYAHPGGATIKIGVSPVSYTHLDVYKRQVVVSAADVTVTVTERRAKGEGQGGTWRVSSEALRALAADPRLVPPRPTDVPTLPSYLGCRMKPDQPGCPTTIVPSDRPTSAPAATSRPSEDTGVPAGQVKARIAELGRATMGAGATTSLRIPNPGDRCV